jgi:hypothetical protein
LFVKTAPRINNAPAGGHSAEGIRVDQAIFGPVGEVHDKICTDSRLYRRDLVLQVRKQPCGTCGCDRVVDGYPRTLGSQATAHIQARRITHVIAAGLERYAQHSDTAAIERASRHLSCQVDGPGAAAKVDRVDLVKHCRQ